MNNSFAVNDRFEITPRSGGIPLAAFVGGIAFFIFLLLAIYFNSLYFIPAACLLLPLLYLNKTATLYVYVLVYAYALPIYSYQGDLRLDDLLFIVLVSTWLMDKMLNPCAESQKKPFTRPLILWLGINALTIFMVFFKYGLFFTIRSGYFFIRMAEYVSIYFIISDMIKDQKTRIIIIRLIWIITLFICSVGLYQYHISGLPSITSTLSESHVYLGTFLMFTFFILAGYIFVTKNVLEKIALLLTLPLMIYILFLSALRTGILSIIVGIIVFFVFSRKPIGWMVAVVLAIILILFGFEFLQNLQEYELGSAGFRNLERDLSTMGRFYIWYGTIVMLKQNPTILITGVGLSAFGLAVERYTPLFPGSGGAHNNYLHHLTETGMFGLAIFLYILFIFLRTSLKRSREPAQKDRALYYGYFCGLAALVFSGMSQETFSVQNAHGNFLGYFFIVTSLVFSKPKNFYDETENEIS